MKQIIGILSLLFFVTNVNAETAPFEGTMVATFLTGTNVAGAETFNLTVKNNHILVTPVTDKTIPRILLNNATGVLNLLMDGQGQKMAIQLNLNSLNGLGGVSTFLGKSYGFSEKSTTIKATSETKLVNGYNCIKYVAKDATYSTTFWVTNEIDLNFAGILGIDQKFPELKNKMVIKATGKNLKTGETFSINVKPTPKKVDDATLNIPSGYQQMDMTNVIDNMMKTNKPEDVKKMILGMMKH